MMITWALLEAAVEAGRLEACKLLREQYGCPWNAALYAAANSGNLQLCEWMLVSGCPLTPYAVSGAARGGHEGLMLWRLQRLWEDNGAADVEVPRVMAAAAEGLGLAALQLLHQQSLAGQQERQQGGASAGAGSEGAQLPPVQLSQDQCARVMAAAASSATPDLQSKVEGLEGLGFPSTEQAGTEAASTVPAIDTVRWLHAMGLPPEREGGR